MIKVKIEKACLIQPECRLIICFIIFCFCNIAGRLDHSCLNHFLCVKTVIFRLNALGNVIAHLTGSFLLATITVNWKLYNFDLWRNIVHLTTASVSEYWWSTYLESALFCGYGKRQRYFNSDSQSLTPRCISNIENAPRSTMFHITSLYTKFQNNNNFPYRKFLYAYLNCMVKC